MKKPFIYKRIIAPTMTLAVGLATLVGANVGRAQYTVDPGWDLLQSIAIDPVLGGTTFNGMNWQGVPLGSYNFGGSIGVQSVGNADTIVQRLQTASVPGAGDSATINIQLDALQLQSVQDPSLFITLQSTYGNGPASVGQMTITFNTAESGTFSSFFDVYFDVTYGSLNGPVVQSGDLVLSNSGTPWVNTAPAGALLIDGVNYWLDGTDTLNDFWPWDGVSVEPFVETHPSGAQHEVIPLVVPEPSSPLLVASGAVSLLAYAGRRRKAKA